VCDLIAASITICASTPARSDGRAGRYFGLLRQHRKNGEWAGKIHLLARGFAVVAQQLDLISQLLGDQIAQAVFVEQMVD